MAVPVSSSMVGTEPRIFDNPATGERLVIRTSSAETGGQLLAFDLFLPPRGHVPAQHAHPAQEERFRVIDGVLRFRVGGSTIVAAAGDTVRIPPRTAHWFGNPGPLPAHARVEVRPALRMEELLEAGTLLANSGRLARWHIPAPAALAYLLLEFEQEVAVPWVPSLLVRVILRPFVWLGGAGSARRAAQT